MDKVGSITTTIPMHQEKDLWETIRTLNNNDLQEIQHAIKRSYSIDAPAEVPVALGNNQLWPIDKLLHVFLDHLHQMVRHHQAPTVSSATSDVQPLPPNSSGSTSKMTAAVGFELHGEDFPSLPSNNSKPDMKSTANMQTPAVRPMKRRITTTLLKNPSAITRPVLPQACHMTTPVPSSTWPKRDLLERRMMATPEPPLAPQLKPKASSELQTDSPVHLNQIWPNHLLHQTKQPQISPPLDKKDPSTLACSSPSRVLSKNAADPPPLQVRVKKKQSRRVGVTQLADPIAPSIAVNPEISHVQPMQKFTVNHSAAHLYGFLIKNRYVNNSCLELQMVMSLLYRSDCCGSNNGGTTHSVENCVEPNEFCSRKHSLEFAEIVCNEIGVMLSRLGSDLFALIRKSLRDAEICVELLDELHVIAQRQDELRVQESARIGCKLPIEPKDTTVRDFALPFCEDVDSRLHYRSPTESLMFTNREKVRDGFLNLLRKFQKQQHSLLGIENANIAATAVEAARSLLSTVSAKNRWWFAKFFVMELIQVGSNPFGESDKDLVRQIMEDKLVVKNPDRLRKLHRRFSSQKQSNKQQSGHKGTNLSKSSGNASDNGPARIDIHVSTPSSGTDTLKNVSVVLERMRGYFAENQLFFFHFLHSCDSYEFSQLVKQHLEGQFFAIWKRPVASDPRKTFTDVVLKLKVIAKFLGYLRFSPQWHNSSAIDQLSQQNVAFMITKKEAISTLEATERSSGLDVKSLLEESIMTSKISKCIPWLRDYLSMMSLDKLSIDTSYFKQLLLLLERLYRSPCLDMMGETGLYIGLQIELIFHNLGLDISGYFRSHRYLGHHQDLFPSNNMRHQLEQQLATEDNREDNLPFLCSQVFIQSCLGELEDLRGFIQTRANPSHHISSARRGMATTLSNHKGNPIRKLRPLQVMTEEEIVEGNNKAVNPIPSSAEGKLSEAIFKVHPNLKNTVEHVVDAVATNVCEHVMKHVVSPRADFLVDSCAVESGWDAIDRAPGVNQSEAVREMFLQLMDNKASSAIKETSAVALETACRLCEERVRGSLHLLVPPSSHPTLVQSIVLVAVNRAHEAMKNLVPKSTRTEFAKRIATRKKSIVKETYQPVNTKSDPSNEQPQEDPVVRALSNVFDDHAGKETTDKEEYLISMKQISVEMFRTLNRPNLNVDNWIKMGVTLSRHLHSFKKSWKAYVTEEEEAAAGSGHLHDMVLWDPTWRVISCCLRFVTGFWVCFGECVQLGKDPMEEQRAEQVLQDVVSKFTALLQTVVELSLPHADNEVVLCRLISMVLRVVTQGLFLPSNLVGSKAIWDKLDSVHRFAADPIARILMTLMDILPPELLIDWSPLTMATPDKRLNTEAHKQFYQIVWDLVDSRRKTPSA